LKNVLFRYLVIVNPMQKQVRSTGDQSVDAIAVVATPDLFQHLKLHFFI